MDYQDIADSLVKGGFIVVGRASGKTRAMAEILRFDPNAVVIVGLESQGRQLRQYLTVLDVDAGSRIYLAHSRVFDRIPSGRRIYIDEIGYVSHEALAGNMFRVWAATSSPREDGRVMSLGNLS